MSYRATRARPSPASLFSPNPPTSPPPLSALRNCNTVLLYRPAPPPSQPFPLYTYIGIIILYIVLTVIRPPPIPSATYTLLATDPPSVPSVSSKMFITRYLLPGLNDSRYQQSCGRGPGEPPHPSPCSCVKLINDRQFIISLPRSIRPALFRYRIYCILLLLLYYDVIDVRKNNENKKQRFRFDPTPVVDQPAAERTRARALNWDSSPVTHRTFSFRHARQYSKRYFYHVSCGHFLFFDSASRSHSVWSLAREIVANEI